MKNKNTFEVEYNCNCGFKICVSSSNPIEHLEKNEKGDYIINTVVCYKCHPLITGERRIIDETGTLDKFLRKFNYKPRK